MKETKIIQPRFFNTIKVDKKKGTITKTSTETKKFIDEVNWFLNMPAVLANKYTPKIYEYSLNAQKAFVTMEFVNGTNIHELYYEKKLNDKLLNTIISKVKDMLSEFQNFKSPSHDAYANRYNVYIKKLVERILKMSDNKEFMPFFDNPITINGVKYPSLSKIILLILNEASNNLLTSDNFYFIHGDLFSANMIFDTKTQEVKIFDPRGSFGNDKNGGDILYEWAKFIHSFDGGYDWIIEDCFDVSVDKTDIKYNFKYDKKYYAAMRKIVLNAVPKEMYSKVLLIESTLFLSMIPLHADYPKRQLMQLARGIELFYNYIEEINKKK
ncbi:MAG: hypothetical protein LBH55_04095 [Mycoplasmataceae bacterium]|nr:hypothetical protein [Mycoplasmataceae bacterium]